MPRGVPNAKKDELGMKYTTFHAPLLANPKLTASGYWKSESQLLWARNALNKSRMPEEMPEGRRGSKVLVIQPGSRFVRIGRASDVAPITVPHVLARKAREPPAVPPMSTGCITRPQPAEGPLTEGKLNVAKGDPVDEKIDHIASSLRDRMRFYKLRIVQNASLLAANFNGLVEGEEAPSTDSERLLGTEDVLVGERIYELPEEPCDAGYAIRWPMYAGRFNRRDYNTHQNALDDLESIWRKTIVEKLGIPSNTFKEYSIVLVIPDIWDRFVVQELVNMLFKSMGFRQIVCQQESLAATYGAGISNACVVDLGAVKTSVACVDDGLVLNDTRISLSIGGDDVSEFLYVLLNRIRFPYKEMDLNRTFDWAVIEDLKCRICTLNESEVGLNAYDFLVRRPRKKPVKYGLRAYDEVILAPMLLFEPRVVDYEKKRPWLVQAKNPNIIDEHIEFVHDHLSAAMLISTQHLMPQAPPPPPMPVASEDATPVPPEGPKLEGQTAPDVIDVDAEMADAPDEVKPEVDASPSLAKVSEDDDGDSKQGQDITMDETLPQTRAQTDQASTSDASSNAIVDPTGESSRPNGQDSNVPPPLADESGSTAHGQTFYGGYPIDVAFEAGKLPLDVAIFNSARAAGGDDRIRKYLQAVLLIGGGALTPGMAHALESRLQAIATPLVPNMEKVQIIPAPKEVDPRMLSWKGAAVLGKMDAVADLWVTAADWDLFGLRALKERCFYLQY